MSYWFSGIPFRKGEEDVNGILLLDVTRDHPAVDGIGLGSRRSYCNGHHGLVDCIGWYFRRVNVSYFVALGPVSMENIYSPGSHKNYCNY